MKPDYKFAYTDGIFGIYAPSINELCKAVKNSKNPMSYDRTKSDCRGVILYNGKEVATADHCGPLTKEEKDKLVFRGIQAISELEEQASTLNPKFNGFASEEEYERNLEYAKKCFPKEYGESDTFAVYAKGDKMEIVWSCSAELMKA